MRFFVFVALFALLPLPVPCLAQPDAGGAGSTESASFDAETAARARSEFEAGLEHFRNGLFREAIHAFQVAASLTPSADISYNIARAYEELARRDGAPSDYDEAITYYRRYLSDRVDPPDRADIEAHILELEERAAAARAALASAPTTGFLGVRSLDEGVTVEVDGNTVGTTPLASEIELPPGRHRLRATRDEHLPFVSEVTIEAGVHTSATLVLMPETTHRAVRGEPIFTWVAFGLGGVALVGSVVLGAIATSDQSQALSPFDADRLAAARGLAGWSDAALGAAIGLATLGVILYFAESAAVGTETSNTDETAVAEADGRAEAEPLDEGGSPATGASPAGSPSP